MRKLNYVMPRHGGILFVSDKKKRLTMALLTVCGMEFVGVAHCHPGNLNHPKGDKWDKGKGKLIAGNRALKKYYDQPFSVRNGFGGRAYDCMSLDEYPRMDIRPGKVTYVPEGYFDAVRYATPTWRHDPETPFYKAMLKAKTRPLKNQFFWGKG